MRKAILVFLLSLSLAGNIQVASEYMETNERIRYEVNNEQHMLLSKK